MERVLGSAFIIEGKRITEVPEYPFDDAWFWEDTTPVEFGYVKKTCPACKGEKVTRYYPAGWTCWTYAACAHCNGTGEV